MKQGKRLNVITTIVASFTLVLTAVWYWDRSNYPIPGVQKQHSARIWMPGTSYRISFDASLGENLESLQLFLRYKKRVRENWRDVKKLNLSDSYWTLPDTNRVAHFSESGIFIQKALVGALEVAYSKFNFEVTHPNRILLWNDEMEIRGFIYPDSEDRFTLQFEQASLSMNFVRDKNLPPRFEEPGNAN